MKRLQIKKVFKKILKGVRHFFSIVVFTAAMLHIVSYISAVLVAFAHTGLMNITGDMWFGAPWGFFFGEVVIVSLIIWSYVKTIKESFLRWTN